MTMRMPPTVRPDGRIRRTPEGEPVRLCACPPLRRLLLGRRPLRRLLRCRPPLRRPPPGCPPRLPTPGSVCVVAAAGVEGLSLVLRQFPPALPRQAPIRGGRRVAVLADGAGAGHHPALVDHDPAVRQGQGTRQP